MSRTLRSNWRLFDLRLRFLAILGTLLIFGGTGVLTYQAVSWLRTGEWQTYSVSWALRLDGLLRPLPEPRDWYGWHKLKEQFRHLLGETLETIPVSFVLLVAGGWFQFRNQQQAARGTQMYGKAIADELGFSKPCFVTQPLRLVSGDRDWGIEERFLGQEPFPYRVSHAVEEVEGNQVVMSFSFLSRAKTDGFYAKAIVPLTLDHIVEMHVERGRMTTPVLSIALIRMKQHKDCRRAIFVIGESNRMTQPPPSPT